MNDNERARMVNWSPAHTSAAHFFFADAGLLLTLVEPSQPMRVETLETGYFYAEPMGRDYPRIQILTVRELFDGKQPQLLTDLPIARSGRAGSARCVEQETDLKRLPEQGAVGAASEDPALLRDNGVDPLKHCIRSLRSRVLPGESQAWSALRVGERRDTIDEHRASSLQGSSQGFYVALAGHATTIPTKERCADNQRVTITTRHKRRNAR